ncbi:hypothetical protein FRB91_008569 [Serendipita sp. 411]|nr:hypothetical protein FRB91_008569 [Serendipita sp. 411]
MHIPFHILLFFPSIASSTALLNPRTPKGGGSGGGGGRGGGGRGSSGGSGGAHGSSGLSAGAGRGLSGDTGHPSIGYGPTNTQNRAANYFSGGGGEPFILPNSYPFPGRAMGGGTRGAVPGTRTYGSGYTYHSEEGERGGVAGQPFPFGFWPIFWVGRGHSDEYGANAIVASQRPGGKQVIVELTLNSTGGNYNISNLNGVNESYWMIGDEESTRTLLSLLVDPSPSSPGGHPYGCSVSNNTVQPFNGAILPTSSTATNSTNSRNTSVHFENVIQWYRASSFALAFTGYNNTFAFPPLNGTSGTGWNSSSPLPEAQVYSPWLRCINTTITAALPIIDQKKKTHFTSLAISLIIVGAVLVFFILCAAGFYLRRRYYQHRGHHNDGDYPLSYQYNALSG